MLKDIISIFPLNTPDKRKNYLAIVINEIIILFLSDQKCIENW